MRNNDTYKAQEIPRGFINDRFDAAEAHYGRFHPLTPEEMGQPRDWWEAHGPPDELDPPERSIPRLILIGIMVLVGTGIVASTFMLGVIVGASL